MPIKDELLKANRRPRTEWKFDDLAWRRAARGGRSFGNGKQIFQVANCIACHKLDGAGHEFGPDLTKLDPKLTAADILREILEPSAKINEKFQTYTFATESRQGRHRPDPRGDREPGEGDREPAGQDGGRRAQALRDPSEAKSPISIMPKGLLDKLTREEILDLVAYIASGANPKSDLYHQAGHAHGAGGH